jgi:hypothetical protein
MNRWFRFYADAIRNPKVAALSDREFRLWVMLLSAASENEGTLPPATELRHVLSIRLDHLLSGLDRLIKAGLIDALERGYSPHNWGKFQYKSDTSTDRVHKHRAQRNVSETPPEAEQTQKQKTQSAQQPQSAPEPAAAAPMLSRRAELDALQAKLAEACGEKIQPHGLLKLSPVLGLIEAGLDLETDILAPIRAKAGTMSQPANNLSYFVPICRQAHEARVAAGRGVVRAAGEDWRGRMEVFRAHGTWAHVWGPKPGERDCRVPAELLSEAA